MDKEEINRQLQEENAQLKHKIEELLEYIKDLEARLAKYENAHTPPSLKGGSNRKKSRIKAIMESLVRKSGIKV